MREQLSYMQSEDLLGAASIAGVSLKNINGYMVVEGSIREYTTWVVNCSLGSQTGQDLQDWVDYMHVENLDPWDDVQFHFRSVALDEDAVEAANN